MRDGCAGTMEMINSKISPPKYELTAPLLLRAIHRSGMVVLATELTEKEFEGYVLLKTDRTFFELGEKVEMSLSDFEPFRGELTIGNVQSLKAVSLSPVPPFFK